MTGESGGGMAGVTTGRAADAGATGGWFVGHFVPDEARRSSAVEVKWGVHPAGERNAGGFVANRTATTLSVLVSGAFRLRFRAGAEVETVDLLAPGQYALWPPGLPHDWEAVADSVVLTVRWPSVPKDQAEAGG